MSSKTLYIIGNGFDLHHSIPSSYWDFRNHVEKNNPDLFEVLEKYFPPEELWSDFETTLAELDTDQILDDALDYLESYGVEEWKEAYHHDYQDDIHDQIKMVTSVLKQTFTKWVFNLKIPSGMDDLLKLDRNGIFISFNYTATLIKLYHVSRDKIVYIHNLAESESSELLLGHGVNPGTPPDRGDEDEDVRITQGQRIIDGYLQENYKQVDRIIIDQQAFFDTLADIRDVHIYGHSMADVDIPYFEEIIKRLDLSKVNWRASYFSQGEDEQRLAALLGLGIPEDRITIAKLGQFDTDQLALF